MFKTRLLTLILALGLAGCNSEGNFSLEAGMNVSKGSNKETLMGQIKPVGPGGAKFSIMSPTFVPYKQGMGIFVENLENSCSGYTNDVDYTILASGAQDRMKAIIPFECDDGRTGKVKVQVLGGNGTGLGKMSDGSEVKFVVGPKMIGNLSW